MNFTKLTIALLTTSASIASLTAMNSESDYNYAKYSTPFILKYAQKIVENPKKNGPYSKKFPQENLAYAQEIVSNQKKAIQNAPLLHPDNSTLLKYIGYGIAVGPIIHGLVKIKQLTQRQRDLCDINYQFKEAQEIHAGKHSFVNKLLKQKQYHSCSPTLLVQDYMSSQKQLDETYKTKRIHEALDRLSSASQESQIIPHAYNITGFAKAALWFTAPFLIKQAISNKITRFIDLHYLNKMERVIAEEQSYQQ